MAPIGRLGVGEHGAEGIEESAGDTEKGAGDSIGTGGRERSLRLEDMRERLGLAGSGIPGYADSVLRPVSLLEYMLLGRRDPDEGITVSLCIYASESRTCVEEGGTNQMALIHRALSFTVDAPKHCFG